MEAGDFDDGTYGQAGWRQPSNVTKFFGRCDLPEVGNNGGIYRKKTHGAQDTKPVSNHQAEQVGVKRAAATLKSLCPCRCPFSDLVKFDGCSFHIETSALRRSIL